MDRIMLNGEWRFRAVDRYHTLPNERADLLDWIPGTVPGTVHTDLLAGGKIPDPFYRMNENDVQWVDRVQWEYERTVEIPASFLEHQHIVLVASGLDTFATIRCNGKIAGRAENMFLEHRIPLRRFLRPGSNTISIMFDSPTIRAEHLMRSHGPLEAALDSPRVFVRKAQYSFGWDWGPRLTTSGIWRDIAIEGISRGRITDPKVTIRSLSAREAVVDIACSVERFRGARLSARVAIEDTAQTSVVAVRGRLITVRFRLRQPKRWWPNGSGEQYIYNATITLLQRTDEIQRIRVPFALRTVRLLQEKDRDGRSFVFEINGRKIFCKGADWIPGDTFLPRMTEEKYRRLLTMARDANMNMIRVWGGGIYEDDFFYSECDRLGLMVWQDFMYACAEYPDQPWFTKGVIHEARQAVRRLRNHPSIVIWCGNNECEWIYCTQHPGKKPDDMHGARIFRTILPRVCSEEDSSRPYWRSSPYGAGFPNAESNGNRHQWEVWSGWKDYPEYRKDTARFVTEFGFQAPAHAATWRGVLEPRDHHPQSPVMEHHNKQADGTERLFRFQTAHYKVRDGFSDFVYRGQLVQAEALKCAVEHWRRRKWRTAGALFWQLNDCWPVSSWAVIDSGFRPKAAYFYAKKFFAPVLLSIDRGREGADVWVTSDLDSSLTATVAVSIRTFSGTVLRTEEIKVRLGRQANMRIYRISNADLSRYDLHTSYVLAKLRHSDGVVAENRQFFFEAKHLVFPAPRFDLSIRSTGPDTHSVTIASDALARNVELDDPDVSMDLSDNFFDIDGGSEATVQVRSHRSSKELQDALNVRWLH